MPTFFGIWNFFMEIFFSAVYYNQLILTNFMNFQTDIDNCLKTLQQGGTILYPTDTVWGLGCDATNQPAVENLLQIKHRTAFQGLIVIVENELDIFKYAEITTTNINVNADLSHFLKTVNKPTTVIYKRGKMVAPAVLNVDGSIAIRVVQDSFCKELLQKFGKPIVSTSANIHGEPTPSFYKETSESIKKTVDFSVKYRRDDETPRQSSALVRWLSNGQIETIRP